MLAIINKMLRVLDPFRFVLIAVAGWMNQRQLQIIDYPSRGEPGSTRATRWAAAAAAQRRSASSIGLPSERVGTEASVGGGYHCHARDLTRLASETDRAEIRRQ